MTILESITEDKTAAMKTVMEMLDKKAFTALEELHEAVCAPKKSEVPAVMRKAKGEAPLTLGDLDKEQNESPTTKKGLDDLKKKTGVTEGAAEDEDESEAAKDSSLKKVTTLVAKTDSKE